MLRRVHLRTLRALLLLLAMAGSGLPAGAVEVRGGVRGETAWNSNPQGQLEDEEDDFSFRATPWVQLTEPRGTFSWYLEYRPSYEQYLDLSEVDGWDHDVSAGFDWRLRPDTTLRFDEQFIRYASVTRFNETVGFDDAGDAVTEIVGDVNRFRRNRASLQLQHQLSPVHMLFAGASHVLFDYSADARTDRTNLSVNGGYRNLLNERNTVGIALSWRRQTFEPATGDDRETDFYNLSLTWEHRFDPTFDLNVSVGPTYVDPRTSQSIGGETGVTLRFPGLPHPDPSLREAGVLGLLDAATCPTFPDGTPYFSAECDFARDPRLVDAPVAAFNSRLEFPLAEVPDPEGRITVFADVSLTKRWQNWTLGLSYRRQEDDAGGIGVSTISDSVSGSLTWKPSPRWRFDLTGSWILQEQSSDFVQQAVLLRQGVAVSFPGIFVEAAEATGLRALEVSSGFEHTQIRVGLRSRYRLTRRISLYGSLVYLDVEREGTLFGNFAYDRVRAAIGVSYEFEPIRL